MSNPEPESTDFTTTLTKEMRDKVGELVLYIDKTRSVFTQFRESNNGSNEKLPGGGRKENVDEAYVYPHDISDPETVIYTRPKKEKGEGGGGSSTGWSHPPEIPDHSAPASTLAALYTERGEPRGWGGLDEKTEMALLESQCEEWSRAHKLIQTARERDGKKWDSEPHAVQIRILFSKILTLAPPTRNTILEAMGSAEFDTGQETAEERTMSYALRYMMG